MERIEKLRKEIRCKNFKSLREKFLLQIELQEILCGKSEEIEIVKKFQNCCTTERQFYGFIKVVFNNYGVNYKEHDWFYFPKEELIKLSNIFEK